MPDPEIAYLAACREGGGFGLAKRGLSQRSVFDIDDIF
jgi:hypothetical protein